MSPPTRTSRRSPKGPIPSHTDTRGEARHFLRSDRCDRLNAQKMNWKSLLCSFLRRVVPHGGRQGGGIFRFSGATFLCVPESAVRFTWP